MSDDAKNRGTSEATYVGEKATLVERLRDAAERADWREVDAVRGELEERIDAERDRGWNAAMTVAGTVCREVAKKHGPHYGGSIAEHCAKLIAEYRLENPRTNSPPVQSAWDAALLASGKGVSQHARELADPRPSDAPETEEQRFLIERTCDVTPGLAVAIDAHREAALARQANGDELAAVCKERDRARRDRDYWRAEAEKARSTDYAPPGPNQLNVVLSFSDLELLGMALETERATAVGGRFVMLTDLQDKLAKAWTAAGVAEQKRIDGT